MTTPTRAARAALREYLGVAAKGEEDLIDALIAAVRAEERGAIARDPHETVERLEYCRQYVHRRITDIQEQFELVIDTLKEEVTK